MSIEDQPPPKTSTRRPAWELVIEYLEHQHKPNELEPIVAQLIADMRERDKIGRECYGTPLQADNGRDHLIDSYQELLDHVVYLAAELDQRGLSLLGGNDKPVTEQDDQVAILWLRGLDSLVMMRELLSNREH